MNKKNIFLIIILIFYPLIIAEVLMQYVVPNLVNIGYLVGFLSFEASFCVAVILMYRTFEKEKENKDR